MLYKVIWFEKEFLQGRLGQENVAPVQEAFHDHLLNGKGSRQVLSKGQGEV